MDLEQRLRAQPLELCDVWSPQKTARLPRQVLGRLRRRSLANLGLALVACTGLVVATLVRSGGGSAPPFAQRGVAVTASAAPAQPVAGSLVLPRKGSPAPAPQAPAEPENARPSPTSARRGAEPPSWRELAESGDYAGAYAVLGRDKAAVRQVPEELMLAADVERKSGHPAQAAIHLQAVAQRFPRDPRAPVASFTLGRLLLDQLGKPAEAAAAFRRARSSWPAGPLAQDAWAEEAEALRRAGQLEAAQSLAAQYLERYPRGARVDAMRRLARAR